MQIKKDLRRPPQKKEGGQIEFPAIYRKEQVMTFYDMMLTLIVLAMLFTIIRR